MQEIAVEIHRLYKSFSLDHGKKFPVLQGISANIRRGEFCAVIGESGSGKTTLLHLLAGFDRPDSGTVKVFGRNIGENEEEFTEYRRKNVGFIFQAFHLIPELTVMQNIAFPLTLQGVKKSVRREKAERYLELMNLEAVRDHLPRQLSGGQQQRTAIGRALITEPGLVLADEPTGNLDSVNSREIMDLLKRVTVAEGKTLIMVTHDVQYAQEAGQRIHIADGRCTGAKAGSNP